MVPGTNRPSSTLLEELSPGDTGGAASTSVSADVASSGAAHQEQKPVMIRAFARAGRAIPHIGRPILTRLAVDYPSLTFSLRFGVH